MDKIAGAKIIERNDPDTVNSLPWQPADMFVMGFAWRWFVRQA